MPLAVGEGLADEVEVAGLREEARRAVLGRLEVLGAALDGGLLGVGPAGRRGGLDLLYT